MMSLFADVEPIRDVVNALVAPFALFLAINDRLYWGYLLVAFTVAFFLYVTHKQDYEKAGVGTLDFIFPKTIVFHRSALNDYGYFYTNMLLQAAFIGALFSSLAMVVSQRVETGLTGWLPDVKGCWRGAVGGLPATLLLAVVADFALFFSHYLQHKIPWLWAFHKVHHSAEVMTPITVYRMHPVDNILALGMSGLLSGAALGCISFLMGNPVVLYTIGGTDVVVILFYFLGYNLRHSHVWWSWGPVLNRIFISPAQHQIHHSAASQHFDKNMGFTFAFWDALFGTLYVPKTKETLTFGLGAKENEKFATFWSLYLRPVIHLAQNFRLRMLLQPKRYGSVLVFLAVVVPSVYGNHAGKQAAQAPGGVYLEEMTWQEVQNAIKAGSTTAIIPTGGTEQNGPQMILGKHNAIVKYAAGKIAEKLGQALVAPVVAYVPEGTISPPAGHMKFSGTLSVAEATFEAVLEAAAESLKQHGFKVIALVGDSGGNQAAQQRVAERLTRLWRHAGVRVLQINDYYQNNGQLAYLMKQGFSVSQIGGHAGIRDTSELMFVQPEGIRERFRDDHSGADFAQIGADGDAGKASPMLGRILLDLKVDAAVNQIRRAGIHPATRTSNKLLSAY